MSWRDTQRRLREIGYALAVDGVPGPQTYGALFAYMGAKDTAAQFGAAAAKYFPEFGIDTPLRVAHFLAQCAAETGDFRYLREIWGPTDAQRRYEGRVDLGNCIPGDGHRFLGRGIFQITGRDNYERYGKRCGLDLACNPQLAEQPETALHVACLYWNEHGLNEYADADNILGVSNGINRGNPASIREPNGYDMRKAALRKAKRVLA
ncbi:MAG TPA: glycoside hydrolase family 19 protein [Burkholderiales bacterium]|nr:glycoside hydrolase family 19 protein [Burkholderiales bacterium]